MLFQTCLPCISPVEFCLLHCSYPRGEGCPAVAGALWVLWACCWRCTFCGGLEFLVEFCLVRQLLCGQLRPQHSLSTAVVGLAGDVAAGLGSSLHLCLLQAHFCAPHSLSPRRKWTHNFLLNADGLLCMQLIFLLWSLAMRQSVEVSNACRFCHRY